MDQAEKWIVDCPEKVHCPVINRFTPGLYIREILIPAGTLITSMSHRKEHPFVISHGHIRVSSETEGDVIYRAPHTGITKPGTKRILYAIEDTIWTTFHVTDETDIEKIGLEILNPHDNPLLEDDQKNYWRESLPKKIEL